MVDAAAGGVLDEITVEATAEGYAELVEFANNHAILRAWAIEGTGGHGAGLSRHLLESSEIVIESDRPKRAARRNGAKSDPLDAIRAAREAMARPRLGTPRTGGERQALSVLLAARRCGAINASTEAQQQVFSLVIAAPNPFGLGSVVRARCDAQHRREPVRVHAASWDTETTSTVVALRTLARRAHAMLKEARELQKAIVAIIRSWRPDLLEEFGIGPIVAATVLCAWSHPGRIHSEAAFAMLAGVAPIPANSGQVTTRYRLNRYGDRQLNNALHIVVQSRIQYQPATRDYVARIRPRLKELQAFAVGLVGVEATHRKNPSVRTRRSRHHGRRGPRAGPSLTVRIVSSPHSPWNPSAWWTQCARPVGVGWGAYSWLHQFGASHPLTGG